MAVGLNGSGIGGGGSGAGGGGTLMVGGLKRALNGLFLLAVGGAVAGATLVAAPLRATGPGRIGKRGGTRATTRVAPTLALLQLQGDHKGRSYIVGARYDSSNNGRSVTSGGRLRREVPMSRHRIAATSPHSMPTRSSQRIAPAGRSSMAIGFPSAMAKPSRST